MTTHAKLTVPSSPPPHVAAGLVRDFDVFDMNAIDGDIHKTWHQFHDGPDIFYTPRNGGHWVFTRAEDIQEAYRNYDLFSSQIVSIPYVNTGFRFAPAEYDPPELSDYRNALAPAFSPKALRNYEQIVSDLSANLIEGFIADGECEFQEAVAQRLPIAVFLGMMGFPMEDAAMLLPLVEDQTRSPDPARVQSSMDAMIAYLSEKLDDRRRTPRDDLATKVIDSTIQGRPATEQEVFSMCINLMFAGLDTVVAELGFSMRFLATHPEHQRQLADDPSLIPEAVEELLRYHGVTNLARMVRNDMQFKGIEMRAGDPVLLSTTLFGLDDRQFPDPMTIDFHRENKAHMIFGSGPHRCLGSHLARLELRTFLEHWFARIPEFQIKAGEKVIAESGKNNAMLYLPLSWRRN
ncbi:MAG: cytochrome P450 [Sphingobium phenoxybenzoativorans]|uniref:Cytochrome P450 n=1 Tax=Sphingobium phenoxybenzoativorans TaxID=1592790 RepID=A0A975Q2E1_9SPHN|nr:cytochrome P450 [Sphingobium phenoxybenzoativorans]QUT06759.1 cytochrome P450 [Sphingobium phenoxybenzoativorans]